ncbi:unnamed protein product [Peronospora farinosa]|uniref:Uncharacterized protein n=1 Tax=Peronospora farinosa TaxID=134698 RepID=A0AAV0ST47_9STRA|nr:unnamed protein product [Peronospora farinosa]CAI5707841.1 unnamed protein product [Peronospora farinosa]
MDLEGGHITYSIDTQVIEVVIGEMLWDPRGRKNSHKKCDAQFYSEDPLGDYAVTIKTPTEYRLAIKHVGIGINMKQTPLAIQAAKEVTNVSKLTGMIQAKAIAFVRVQCAANSKTIANVLRLIWAFSIGLKHLCGGVDSQTT